MTPRVRGKEVLSQNQRQSRMVVVRGWGLGVVTRTPLMSMEFQFYKMKRIMETDGAGCTALPRYLIPLSRTIKNS